jgi:hypothetical protein
MKYKIFKIVEKSVGIGSNDFYRGEQFSGETFHLLEPFDDTTYYNSFESALDGLKSFNLYGEYTIIPVINFN